MRPVLTMSAAYSRHPPPPRLRGLATDRVEDKGVAGLAVGLEKLVAGLGKLVLADCGVTKKVGVRSVRRTRGGFLVVTDANAAIVGGGVARTARALRRCSARSRRTFNTCTCCSVRGAPWRLLRR